MNILPPCLTIIVVFIYLCLAAALSMLVLFGHGDLDRIHSILAAHTFENRMDSVGISDIFGRSGSTRAAVPLWHKRVLPFIH